MTIYLRWLSCCLSLSYFASIVTSVVIIAWLLLLCWLGLMTRNSLVTICAISTCTSWTISAFIFLILVMNTGSSGTNTLCLFDFTCCQLLKISDTRFKSLNTMFLSSISIIRWRIIMYIHGLTTICINRWWYNPTRLSVFSFSTFHFIILEINFVVLFMNNIRNLNSYNKIWKI